MLVLLAGTTIESMGRLEVVLWTDWVLEFKPDKEILCGDTVGGETIVLLAVKAGVESAAKESELDRSVYKVCVTLMDVPDTAIDIETLPRSELL